MVRVSVIVPTYRRPVLLMECLSSLQEQAHSDLEPIVVDNAADARVAADVERFNASARVPAKYVAEPSLGLHNARHAGARAASGDVLLFTDDDATFHPGWSAAYARWFDAHPEMAAAGGPVQPVWATPPPEWLRKLMRLDPTMFPALSLIDLAPEFRLGTDGIFFGVNMAVRPRALREAGGFNPEIFGERWLGDGETGLQRKLAAQGKLIGYVPDAVVYHAVPRERMTLSYLRKRQVSEGACDMYAQFHGRRPGALELVAAAWRVARDSARDWLAEPLLRGRTDPRSLRVQLRAARAWSRLQYVLRLMVSPELRALVARKDWL